MVARAICFVARATCYLLCGQVAKLQGCGLVVRNKVQSCGCGLVPPIKKRMFCRNHNHGGQRVLCSWPSGTALTGKQTTRWRSVAPKTGGFTLVRGVSLGPCDLMGCITAILISRHYPVCALHGIAARWLGAHYKDIARVIARAMARGLGFVTPCPNKQGKNAYFSKVSDASGTTSDVVNVRKDCKHFGPPLWVVLVEERGPFGGPS